MNRVYYNAETLSYELNKLDDHHLDLIMKHTFKNKEQKLHAILSATDAEINTGLRDLGFGMRIHRGEQ